MRWFEYLSIISVSQQYTMKIFTILTSLDILANQRIAQLEHEETFDKNSVPIIDQICGINVTRDILLIRSDMNRILTRSVKDASWIDRYDKYAEQLIQIDKMNQSLTIAMEYMQDPNNQCGCAHFHKIIKSYKSMKLLSEKTAI
jgi:hypothetical protein